MSDNLKSIIFAAATAVICSLLLTGASSGLKEYRVRNMTLDKQKNILKSIQLMDSDRSYKPKDIEALYTKNIKGLWVDNSGRITDNGKQSQGKLPIFLYVKNDNISAYVIPISTRGLWGKIQGYLALESDGSTISGFTVYKHSETPGLGGEIESAWFRKNFRGKKIVDDEGNFVSISVAKGMVSEKIPAPQRKHFVDGISGATLTGKLLTSGFRDILSSYEPVSITFRTTRVELPAGT